MNNEIRKYFIADRTHAIGVALVMKYSHRLSLKKQLNIQPESIYLTGVVHEELRELAAISRDELAGLLAAPVVKEQPESDLSAGDQILQPPDPFAEKKESRKK
ncbi:MAG: hypothetical protein ACOYNC_14890 [Bacteroidales bacterium]